MVLTQGIENMQWEIYEAPIGGMSLLPAHVEAGLENSLRHTWPWEGWGLAAALAVKDSWKTSSLTQQVRW